MTNETIDAAELQTEDVFDIPGNPLYGSDARHYRVVEREMESEDRDAAVLIVERTGQVRTPQLSMFVHVSYQDPDGSVITMSQHGTEHAVEEFGTEVIPTNN